MARTNGIWTPGANAINFTGLGHTIGGLNITNTTASTGGGVFNNVTNSMLRDIGLTTGTVTGSGGNAYFTGGLVGIATTSTIKNSYANVTVTSGNTNANGGTGGLVGTAISSSVSNSYTTGPVSGSSTGGGLEAWLAMSTSVAVWRARSVIPIRVRWFRARTATAAD
ncbi:GLUG motif-containing protein [Comamonas sp. lk]|uniref:GLUG motif-containing protein n=1 Tax=Comamonas sp. lk TaxID=2201272 RepID=UPI000EAC8835|nr:GLUG motif-containing protein [Comamonas sp. lk]